MESAVEISGLTKRFGTTVALDDVAVAFAPGKIHAIIGENGSGKSTLFKVLAGVYAPDAGSLSVRGEPVSLPVRPNALPQLGFAFVHQDLGIAPSMSILDNVRVGQYRSNFGWWIPWRAERRAVRQDLLEFGLDADPDLPAEILPQAEQTLLAVVRALSQLPDGSGSLLVLDEPTAYLPGPDRERLYEVMRNVAASGIAVAFSTHHMDEARILGDEITVLRDGQVAGRYDADVPERKLVAALLGREMDHYFPDVVHEPKGGTPVLSVRGLRSERLSELSFEVQAGEVVGITGLVGMGQDEVPYLITGAKPRISGTVHIGGRAIDHLSPSTALQAGMGLLPADRQNASGAPMATLRENLTLPYVGTFVQYGRLQHARERAHTRDVLVEMNVRPGPYPDLPLGSLSGGNQQKVLFAKWLTTPGLSMFVLHEPTQGIDIGAKKELMRAITQLATGDRAVLLVSSEYSELAHLADRVLVMRKGELVTELLGEMVAEDQIIRHCHLSPKN